MTFELYSFFVIIMGFVAVVTMFLSEDWSKVFPVKRNIANQADVT